MMASPFGWVRTASVNMASAAGTTASSSSGPASRTQGSRARPSSLGGTVVAMSGCDPRTARGIPHDGESNAQSPSTSSDGPNSEEAQRLRRRSRWAKAGAVSGPTSTGTTLAPVQTRDRHPIGSSRSA